MYNYQSNAREMLTTRVSSSSVARTVCIESAIDPSSVIKRRRVQDDSTLSPEDTPSADPSMRIKTPVGICRLQTRKNA